MNKKLYDLQDAAKFFGVSSTMIHRYIDQGRLKPFLRRKNRMGDPLRFTLAELKQFERPKRGRPAREAAEGGERKC